MNDYENRLLAQTADPCPEPCPPSSPENETHGFGRKNHHPPLGQRERSTSAPNVCYNVVGHPTDLTEDFIQRMTKGTYTTLHGNVYVVNYFRILALSAPVLLFVAYFARRWTFISLSVV